MKKIKFMLIFLVVANFAFAQSALELLNSFQTSNEWPFSEYDEAKTKEFFDAGMNSDFSAQKLEQIKAIGDKSIQEVLLFQEASKDNSLKTHKNFPLLKKEIQNLGKMGNYIASNLEKLFAGFFQTALIHTDKATNKAYLVEKQNGLLSYTTSQKATLAQKAAKQIIPIIGGKNDPFGKFFIDTSVLLVNANNNSKEKGVGRAVIHSTKSDYKKQEPLEYYPKKITPSKYFQDTIKCVSEDYKGGGKIIDIAPLREYTEKDSQKPNQKQARWITGVILAKEKGEYVKYSFVRVEHEIINGPQAGRNYICGVRSESAKKIPKDKIDSKYLK